MAKDETTPNKPRGAGADFLIAIAGAVAGGIAVAWLVPTKVVIALPPRGDDEKDETPAD